MTATWCVPTPSKHSQHPVLMALGASIRASRKRAGLSQEQLAQLTNMDRSYIGQIERGQNSVAILPLKEIANALQTTISALMDEAMI